ncbi:glycosyltransferase family 4 protein [Streptomyces albireticuli]|uniref:Glycosyltransferase n=1 Tax=Streptomyces albireticuli TaxID=1940 RepID=A0A2A2DC17_9ACTN|nr:glycosyltransferase family 4 protein [Streptomyces albireticuli]MCD9143565.1 glycosyltransferase family 4 protein [Streptomyces albireticuli]MCD9164924.1 glycosyltransferase family 4 protein [Streptomyces albireticuli]MCD9191682.1 glycosyltransferase family 4 protein [Streptomyces albireticuli]PAU48939.1 glycosyltransferase [Streptomyces albireticuli]
MSSTAVPPHGRPPLHAVQVLGGGGAGSGAHVRSLAAGLVARGLRVTVCAPRGTGEGYGFAGSGAAFSPLGTSTDARAVAGIRAASAGADVVHAHGLRSGVLAALALRGRRTPLVVTWHTKARAVGARAQFVRLMERRAARAAAVVLGVTADLVDRARQRGARDARLAPVAVPPPRPTPDDDEPRRHKARAELGAVARPLLVTVGRLDADRGHGPLLDAARDWRELDPEPLLIVAGEGRERPELQRRIESEGLPVLLVGRRDDVPELLATADVAILSSRWEARSVLAQEALHAGVPLVATAVGGVPDLVGDAAELVPYGDAAALSAAVTRLLGDPDRRAALVAAGFAQAATWPSEDDTVAHVLSVYDELAAGGGR